MLPFELTHEAKARVDSLGEIVFTFRVWGFTPEGALAIEVFSEDMTQVRGFKNTQFEQFKEGEVTAHIPINHLEYIRGVTVDFSGWVNDDEKYYSWDRTFIHRGFYCLAHEVDFSDLRLSFEQVRDIIQKQFFMSFNGPFVVRASNAARQHLQLTKAVNGEIPSDEEFIGLSFTLQELQDSIAFGFEDTYSDW